MNVVAIIFGIFLYMFIGALWAVATKQFSWLPFHDEDLSYLTDLGVMIWPVMLALYILILLYYLTIKPIHYFFYGIAKVLTDKR